MMRFARAASAAVGAVLVLAAASSASAQRRQATDAEAIVILSARAYEGALTRTNATYVHEMAHLFTWRYHSHTLREGLADYLALQIHPGAGVGPNADGYDQRTAIPPEVAEYLGT